MSDALHVQSGWQLLGSCVLVVWQMFVDVLHMIDSCLQPPDFCAQIWPRVDSRIGHGTIYRPQACSFGLSYLFLALLSALSGDVNGFNLLHIFGLVVRNAAIGFLNELNPCEDKAFLTI